MSKKEEGYNNSFENVYAKKESIDKRLKFQFYNNGNLNNYSSINLSYLKKIIVLCKAEKIELVLLNTPLHSYYKNNVPNEYINKYNEFINLYNLEVIDFSGLHLMDDCFVPDGDHVSKKGSIITSKEIFKILKARTHNIRDSLLPG